MVSFLFKTLQSQFIQEMQGISTFLSYNSPFPQGKFPYATFPSPSLRISLSIFSGSYLTSFITNVYIILISLQHKAINDCIFLSGFSLSIVLYLCKALNSEFLAVNGRMALNNIALNLLLPLLHNRSYLVL
jgi:hypothetical protein